MFTVVVEITFSATHRVTLPNGTLEPPHDHAWLVRAHFSRPDLNRFGMVIDFETAQTRLRSVVADLEHRDLNEVSGLSVPTPTAEVLAKYLYDRLRALDQTTVRRVEVVETPGCLAVYELPGPPDPVERSC